MKLTRAAQCACHRLASRGSTLSTLPSTLLVYANTKKYMHLHNKLADARDMQVMLQTTGREAKDLKRPPAFAKLGGLDITRASWHCYVCHYNNCIIGNLVIDYWDLNTLFSRLYTSIFHHDNSYNIITC